MSIFDWSHLSGDSLESAGWQAIVQAPGADAIINTLEGPSFGPGGGDAALTYKGRSTMGLTAPVPGIPGTPSIVIESLPFFVEPRRLIMVAMYVRAVSATTMKVQASLAFFAASGTLLGEMVLGDGLSGYQPTTDWVKRMGGCTDQGPAWADVSSYATLRLSAWGVGGINTALFTIPVVC